MNRSDRQIWVDGEYVPESRSVVSGTSPGLTYGAGCFETLRVNQGVPDDLEAHLERLSRGLAWLEVDRVFHPVPETVRQVIDELLVRNRLLDRVAVVRIQASLQGGRGYATLEGEEGAPIVIISAAPYSEHRGEYRLKRVQTTVIPGACRPADLKLSNTLHFMKAMREAQAAGADDALMVTSGGYLAESAVANLFWMSGRRVCTPSRACDILPGIVRGKVIDLLEQHPDYSLEQGSWTPDVLESADLVWVTNSLKRVQPVTSLDSRRFPADHPIYHYLKGELASSKGREASRQSQEAPQETKEAPRQSQEAQQETKEAPQQSQEAPQQSQGTRQQTRQSDG